MMLKKSQAVPVAVLATISAIAGMALLNPAIAADITWGADIGTSGVGIHAGMPLSFAHGLQARIGANYLHRYTFSRRTERVAYDFRASLRTIDLLLDWHPWSNGFRLTAGAIYNNNVVNAIGIPNRVATFVFNDETFNTTQVGKLIGRLDFPRIAPYLGIGWQAHAPAERGWSLSSDLGIMYQGSPRTSLEIGGCLLPANGCDLASTLLRPAIATETARLNEDLHTYRFFPVARLGLNYRF